MVVEGILFAAGLWCYLKSTRANDVLGKWGFWALCGTLIVVFVGIFLLPVPKSESWVVIAGPIQLLFVAWGFGLDDYRKSI
jgi:hypothetical protein